MTDLDPKKMALQIAGLRANETHLPKNERVFEDPYAEFFFPDEIRSLFQNQAMVKSELEKYEQLMPGVNGAIVARIKFIDTYLKDCIANDFKQLVIIGAGYDTRAYRFEDVKLHLKVFEVDHPLTQTVKIEKLKEIFKQLPGHVTFIPVVFSRDRLDQKLMEGGYNPAWKTLFIIEGVLMYMPPTAVESLLTFITNSSGPGSSFVADFFDTAVVQGASPLKEAQALRQFVKNEGTNLQFGIEAEKAASFFEKRGFDHVNCVTAEMCKPKFFKNDSWHRAVSPMFNFVHGTVIQK